MSQQEKTDILCSVHYKKVGECFIDHRDHKKLCMLRALQISAAFLHLPTK